MGKTRSGLIREGMRGRQPRPGVLRSVAPAKEGDAADPKTESKCDTCKKHWQSSQTAEKSRAPQRGLYQWYTLQVNWQAN
jgi:hypothetical protein